MENPDVNTEVKTDLLVDIKLEPEEYRVTENEDTHANVVCKEEDEDHTAPENLQNQSVDCYINYKDPGSSTGVAEHLEATPEIKQFDNEDQNIHIERAIEGNPHVKPKIIDKRYTCDKCDKSYIYKSRLNYHKRTHSGEKPFTCNICNKTFTQKGSLHNHVKVHMGIKPYSCDICKKSFTQMSSINIHKQIHARIKEYSCDICNKTFVNGDSIEVHKRLHSKLEPNSCYFCKESFEHKSNLIKHLENVHRIGFLD